MSLLADHGNEILFVEPITSLPTRMLVPEYREVQAGLITRMVQVRPRIHVLTPPMLLPLASRSKLACVVNQSLLCRILRRWQEKLGLRNPILWTYSPYSVYLLGKLGEKLTVYDCTDERTANPLVGKEHIGRLETELIRKADLVFVTAKGLLERKSPLNPNTFLAPNGVHFQHFARAWSTTLEVPADAKHLPHPIIGFIGAISYWIDLDLIEFIAKAKPDWTIVMIGPVRPGTYVASISSLPNVYFLGKKDWKELPNYLQIFDVCINPFKVDEPITETVNPLKVYEYLAAAKPVVSVDMPEVRELEGVLRIASTYEGFLREMELALREEDPSAAQIRIKVAQQHDWKRILAAMSDRIRLAV
jgi:glycosyltransferase involved in cell wall biosynthesis